MTKPFSKSAKLLLLWALACSICPGASLAVTETFDGSPVFTLPTGYGLSSLTGIGGAPNTTPPLPINQGGDLELRFTTPYSFSSRGLALAPSMYGDVRMDGYIGFGIVVADSGGSASFIVRNTGGVFGNFYVAGINFMPDAGNPHPAYLYISRYDNGVSYSLLSVNFLPTFNPLQENYHLAFEAIGSELRASVARVTAQNGQLIEATLAQVSATDNRFASGQAGLYTHIGTSANSIFYDDISITAIPEPTVPTYLGAGLLCWVCRAFARRGAANMRRNRNLGAHPG